MAARGTCTQLPCPRSAHGWCGPWLLRWARRGRTPPVARWRLRAGGLLDDNACCTCCTTGHTLRTSLTPSTREARRHAHPRQRRHPVPEPAFPHDEGPSVVWPACPPPVAARRRSLRPTRQPQSLAAAAIGPWRQPRRPPLGGRDPSPSRAGTACRAPALPRAQQRRGQGHPPAAEPASPTAAVPPPRAG